MYIISSGKAGQLKLTPKIPKLSLGAHNQRLNNHSYQAEMIEKEQISEDTKILLSPCIV